ncbi:type II toxin-antitoxin system VapC family toxin [Dinoroseobacter sp. S124A]|uniref:type II toxin-antitoxin system VapC family toxin n=1 Tax=Dinoroseobacter sp. S124A TaxID=3415128 RepID=UPI003C7BC048
MASSSFLWDTCVLYRFLNGEPEEWLDHIEAHLSDVQSGKSDIFVSTTILAEIRPSKVFKPGQTPLQIVQAVSAAFKYIPPSPDIMSLAGHLRDQEYTYINGPEDKASTRELSLGDAIHLATGIALQEEFGVQNLTVHSFDEGKTKDGQIGKKTVPMVGFHNWCRNNKNDEEIQRVLSLKITKPEHPSCKLPKTNPKPTSSAKPPAS